MDESRSPSKPKPTEATTTELLAHFNKQLPAYNTAVRAKFAGDTERIDSLLMEPYPDDYLKELVIKDALIERIRRQNFRLGRHVRGRSEELLLQKKVQADGSPFLKNGRSVGHTYAEILGILAVEFPEASTSVACLRWYVVKMREAANDGGTAWPDLPQVRPRSSVGKAARDEEAAA
jgi:hypothetical protein